MVRLAVAVSMFVCCNSIQAQPPNTGGGRWTVDDILLTERATEFFFSPDGKWLVWVKSAVDKEKGESISQLMRTEIATRRTIELTRGQDSCTSPRWAPDGKHIAFLSSRPGPKPAKPKARSRAEGDDDPRTQVWLIDPFGGEPWRLTDGSRSVAACEWAGPDDLLFVAQEIETLHEKTTRDERKDTSNVVDDESHEPPARLFHADVKSKKVTRKTSNTDRIEWIAASPDGSKVVARHNRSLRYVYDNRTKPIYKLHNLTGGEAKSLFVEPHWNIAAVRWAPDGRGFYVVNGRNSRPTVADYPAVFDMHFFDIASGSLKPIDLQWADGLSTQDNNATQPGFVVTPDGFVGIFASGARKRLARFTRDGDSWKREWLAGDHDGRIFGMQAAPDGKSLVYSHSSASRPDQWFHAALNGSRLESPVAVTTLNESFAKRTPAKSEIVRWKGARDDEIEGILYHPQSLKPGQRAPLIVMIHGGPAAADVDGWDESWSYAANLFTQRGAFVLKPNYHGSTNYGLPFIESIAGHYYELEVPDILKGVDFLIEKGLVDADKLGVYGWSNGGILTAALTTATTRFKAAVAGAGDIDWPSDWANCDFGDSFDRFYLGKSLFEDPQLYIRKSTYYQLDKVRTPTLILFGTEDRAVPTQQGWMHYRALQQLGKTEVRFVLFPGEKHGPKKYVHQRRVLEEKLAWFDRHLFKTDKPAEEALKPDSPLARALAKRTAKQDAGRLGELVEGTLVPETATRHGIRVGKFEVTRAQFAAFNTNYAVAKGEENFPVSGITFQQAEAYCKWLSDRTGETWRLPDDAEAGELYSASETGENTLDLWAGYAVNPDDARRLRDQIAKLPGSTPLLREVGVFAADGPGDKVFDLGGNVAEWTTDSKGAAKLRGGSADQPADPRQSESSAGQAYRGFRVVKVVRPEK